MVINMHIKEKYNRQVSCVFGRPLYYGVRLSCSNAATNGSIVLLSEKENDHERWVQKNIGGNRHDIAVCGFRDTSVLRLYVQA
jgi:hypothetical protein